MADELIAGRASSSGSIMRSSALWRGSSSRRLGEALGAVEIRIFASLG